MNNKKIPVHISIWGDKAACKKIKDPETGEILSPSDRVQMFYPLRQGDRPHPLARKTCMSCPVIEECAEWAIHYEEDGFFANMMPLERNRKRRERGIYVRKDSDILAYHGRYKKRPSKAQECGTYRMYRQHVRLGDEVEAKVYGGCGCLEAWTEEMERRRAIKLERSKANKKKWYERQKALRQQAQTPEQE